MGEPTGAVLGGRHVCRCLSPVLVTRHIAYAEVEHTRNGTMALRNTRGTKHMPLPVHVL